MKKTIAGVMAAVTMSMAAWAMAQTAPQRASQPPAGPGLTLTTAAFEDGGIIPNKYTSAATAPQVSPQLAWKYVPAGTVSFVLIMHDPDTTLNRRTDQIMHWLIFNIPGTNRELSEAVPALAQLPDGSIQLMNRHKVPGYLGPGAGAAGPYHHYTFELYALDTKLNLGPEATQADVESAMQGHILDKGVLVGRFHKP